jgi:hypothetical protein
MGYTFARVNAAGMLRVENYFRQGRRSWLRYSRKAAGGMRCHVVNTSRSLSRNSQEKLNNVHSKFLCGVSTFQDDKCRQ